MVDKVSNNLFLVNAPAGSGKTTKIKTMIQNILVKHPKDNILCITYTNRAADELAKDLTNNKIFIGTIHSFLNNFIRQYFSHKEVIELYFQTYGQDINERISNNKNSDTISDSNNKYIEKYGELNLKTIKKNIKSLNYNETSFNSLYYGGIGHDDLISFSKLIIDSYPKIQKRLQSKYQTIFIDEYQDTSAEVLKLFFESTTGTSTKLYLFGDRMQQIYKNYDGSFEDKFTLFNTDLSLNTNHRSVSEIVDLLNNIYNDTNFEQEYSEKNNNLTSDFEPQVILSNNIEYQINKISEENPDTLVLYLFNSQRFEAVGAGRLYKKLSQTEKYSFVKSYSAVDILTSESGDNPDPLIKLLYLVEEIYDDYKNKKYGVIINKVRKHSKIFDKKAFEIKRHIDKLQLKFRLESIFKKLNNKDITIDEVLTSSVNNNIISSDYINAIKEDEDYNSILEIPYNEIHAIHEYLGNPRISTQHGVKGESHDSVVFIAEDSNWNPVVHMYDFLKLWGNYEISFRSLEQFYYSYIKEISSVQELLDCKINKMNNDIYLPFKDQITKKVEFIVEKFDNNDIFRELCFDAYQAYLKRPGVTKAKACLKENTVYGIFSAYKLFYVGCSRARRNLTILLDKSKLSDNTDEIERRFTKIGFKTIGFKNPGNIPDQ